MIKPNVLVINRKQLLDVQFYRQKPIGDYVVDFCAPKSSLVVEVDGSQHLEPINIQYDAYRDAYLAGCRLRVLRFSNIQVLQEIDAVVDVILQALVEGRGGKPPNPLYERGA